MNKIVFTTLSIVIAVAVFGVLIISGEDSSDMQTSEPIANNQNQSQSSKSDMSADDETTEQSPAERYVDYSPEKLAASKTEKNILFFHAAWCTVCNSVERAIEAGVVPENLTIFKVDFDSDVGQELARKHRIPIQYTSVQVDLDGNELKQWVNQFNDGPLEMLAQTVDAS